MVWILLLLDLVFLKLLCESLFYYIGVYLKSFKAEHFGVNAEVITLSTKFSDIEDLTVWLGKANKQALIRHRKSKFTWQPLRSSSALNYFVDLAYPNALKCKLFLLPPKSLESKRKLKLCPKGDLALFLYLYVSNGSFMFSINMLVFS